MQRADNRRKGIHMLAGARLQLISGLSNKENGKKDKGAIEAYLHDGWKLSRGGET